MTCTISDARAESAKAASSTSVSADPAKPAKPAKLIDGIRLGQDSYLAGYFLVKVSSSVVRCENPRTKTVFLMYPKTNTMAVLNEAGRTYWMGPASAWKPPFSKASYFKRSEYGDLTVFKSEPIVWMGVAATKTYYKTLKKFQGPPLTVDDKLTIVHAESIASKALIGNFNAMAPSLGLIYGVPVIGDGFPLLVQFTTRKNSTKRDLETKLLKHDQLDASEFEIPAGFKRVTKLADAYGESQENLKELMEGL